MGGVGLLVVAPAPDVPSGVGAQPRVSLPKVAILWGFTGAAALERSDARWTPGASSRNVSERPASPSQHRCPGAPRTSALHPRRRSSRQEVMMGGCAASPPAPIDFAPVSTAQTWTQCCAILPKHSDGGIQRLASCRALRNAAASTTAARRGPRSPMSACAHICASLTSASVVRRSQKSMRFARGAHICAALSANERRGGPAAKDGRHLRRFSSRSSRFLPLLRASHGNHASAGVRQCLDGGAPRPEMYRACGGDSQAGHVRAVQRLWPASPPRPPAFYAHFSSNGRSLPRRSAGQTPRRSAAPWIADSLARRDLTLDPGSK